MAILDGWGWGVGGGGEQPLSDICCQSSRERRGGSGLSDGWGSFCVGLVSGV